jgi:starvation-inducible DNA-binding protein
MTKPHAENAPHHIVPVVVPHAPGHVVQQLVKVLSNSYTLAVKTHGAHWNVTGAGFYHLHAAFEAQYQELLQAADGIAERVRALQARPPGSMQEMLDHSVISEFSSDHAIDVVRSLRDDHRLVAIMCREAILVAVEGGDDVTADILIARSRIHDQTAWMLTATSGE